MLRSCVGVLSSSSPLIANPSISKNTLYDPVSNTFYRKVQLVQPDWQLFVSSYSPWMRKQPRFVSREAFVYNRDVGSERIVDVRYLDWKGKENRRNKTKYKIRREREKMRNVSASKIIGGVLGGIFFFVPCIIGNKKSDKQFFGFDEWSRNSRVECFISNSGVGRIYCSRFCGLRVAMEAANHEYWDKFYFTCKLTRTINRLWIFTRNICRNINKISKVQLYVISYFDDICKNSREYNW